MSKELELIMSIMREIRDQHDRCTPQQFLDEMKRQRLEIKPERHPITKAVAEITDKAKALLV